MAKKRMTIVFAIIGLLVLGCAYHLYQLICEAGDAWPAENEPGSLTNQLRRIDGEIAKLRQEVAKIPAAREQLVVVTEEYEMAARVLPRESTPDQLVAAIHTKAQLSGVTPSRLQPSVVGGGGAARGRNQQQGGGFETWRFSISLEGSYDQLATFVNRMEEFDSPDAERTGSEKRFFEVREITITAEDNGVANLSPAAVGQPVRHKSTMVMQTYRYTGD